MAPAGPLIRLLSMAGFDHSTRCPRPAISLQNLSVSEVDTGGLKEERIN